MWRRAPWCGGQRPGVKESALVWMRAPWCGGERPGVEEGALVWRGATWCGGERPDVVEDAFGKERVTHLVRRKAPLRRENSESTSDASRKMTHLALRGRLMPRRREGRPPLPVSAPALKGVCHRPTNTHYIFPRIGSHCFHL